MIETLRDDLDCHRNAPDKEPQRRLDTLEWAGEFRHSLHHRNPGGNRRKRIRSDRGPGGHRRKSTAARPRPGSHRPELPAQGRHRNVETRGLPADDYLRAIALARIILPDRCHLQAPRTSATTSECCWTRHRRLGRRLPDHRRSCQPRAPLARRRQAHMRSPSARVHVWPQADDLPRVCVRAPGGSTEDCASRSWTGLMPRDSAVTIPERVFPEKAEFVKKGDDGADVVLIGERSTQWYSGRRPSPATCWIRDAVPSGAVAEVLEGIEAGQEPGFDEDRRPCSRLAGPRLRPWPTWRTTAQARSSATTSPIVKNRNINYTNVCTFKCRFCGFSKGPLSLNLRGKPYLLTLEEMQERVWRPRRSGPPRSASRAVSIPISTATTTSMSPGGRRRPPTIHIHGFTALEVTEGAKRNGEPLGRLSDALHGRRVRIAAGHRGRDSRDDPSRDSVPGQDQHRGMARCPQDRTSVGLRSNVTMMFGAVETARELGASTSCDPGPSEGDRRLHRVRRAALCAHGVADLPAEEGAPGPDVPREPVGARRGPIAYGATSTTSSRAGSRSAWTACGSCCRPAATTSAAR